MNDIPVTILLLLLAFMGCLVGGPNNIITSAVAADLADDPSIKGNNKVRSEICPYAIHLCSYTSVVLSQLAILRICIYFVSTHLPSIQYNGTCCVATHCCVVQHCILQLFNLIYAITCLISKALGTVTGIINGSGSVTAALGQLAIPVLYHMGIQDGVGYRYVWFFLILCTAVGTSLLSPRIYKELYPARDSPLHTITHQPTRAGYSALNSNGGDRA
jgi:hypothetical protein